MSLTNGPYKGAGLELTINLIAYEMEVSSVEIVAEDADSDFVSFASVGLGGTKDWFLNVTVAQDAATGTLWNYIWNNPTSKDVAFVVRPYGNTTPSATQPHFTGTIEVIGDGAVGFGGEADSTHTSEASFKLTGKPTLVTGV